MGGFHPIVSVLHLPSPKNGSTSPAGFANRFPPPRGTTERGGDWKVRNGQEEVVVAESGVKRKGQLDYPSTCGPKGHGSSGIIYMIFPCLSPPGNPPQSHATPYRQSGAAPSPPSPYRHKWAGCHASTRCFLRQWLRSSHAIILLLRHLSVPSSSPP